MMYTIKKTRLICLLALFALSGCDSFLGGDVNRNPNQVDDITLSAALPPLITNTSQTYYNIGYNTSQIVQHTSNYFASGPDVHNLFRIGGAWTNVYLDVISNAAVVIEKAEQENAPHYAGIAQLLTAMNLGLATDTWGAVPYSEALEGDENLRPAYDSQEQIYDAIQELLDSAITNLQDDSGSLSPGSDDLAYGGNMDQWLKLAHALKARYYIHLTKIAPVEITQNAIQQINQAFTSNADDFQLEYNDRNFNPYYANVALPNNTGNLYLTFSEQLINAMNGDTYGVFDPRLPIMADNGSASTYTGMVNGTGEGGNTDFSEDTWYSTQTAPILMFTYAEAKFIEAEARFLNAGGDQNSTGSSQAAYEAYLEGIRAHMEKLGVAADEQEQYLSDPNVDVGASNLTLEHIMKEKWIALFLNPESWTDLRRYDYSPDIYRNLTLPANQNPELNGLWIRRVAYPLDEFNRNGDNVEAVQQDLNVKMWWDQGGENR